MKTYQLQRETLVRRDRREVFAFFADAGNLEALTPPWLSFQVLSEQPVDMRPGTRIDYRLKIRGIPVRWASEVIVWEPPERFVDEQRRGPYRLWHHEHRFEERPDGTLVVDHVRYAVPGGPLLERLVQRLAVGPDVERIFDYRQARLEQIFG